MTLQPCHVTGDCLHSSVKRLGGPEPMDPLAFRVVDVKRPQIPGVYPREVSSHRDPKGSPPWYDQALPKSHHGELAPMNLGSTVFVTISPAIYPLV
jgi:hypothetical protein